MAHILVVDDEPAIREALCEQLQRNGFAVTAAADAKQAREELAANTIDLIVLDIMIIPYSHHRQMARSVVLIIAL